MLADRRGVASAAMPGPISLPGIIRRHAIDRPQNPALIIHAAKEIEPEEMSYSVLVAQMSKAQERIVQLLPDAGGDQQRVAILAHNSTSYLIHSLAVMELGAMAVHLNWRMPAATLGEQLGTLRCALLFATPALKEAGHAAAAFCSTRIHVELLTPPTPLDEADASAMKPAKIAAPASDAWSDTIAVVFFTSGSTGKPKAIPHTHGSLVWWATNYTAALPEVFDATVPRAHCACAYLSPPHTSDQLPTFFLCAQAVPFHSRPTSTSWVLWPIRCLILCKARLPTCLRTLRNHSQHDCSSRLAWHSSRARSTPYQLSWRVYVRCCEEATRLPEPHYRVSRC